MAVRFQTGEEVTLIFPFGDFRDFQGQHGQQFLYTVQFNGNPREKLYATPTLHRELQAAGVSAGSLFTITKLGGEGGQYWRVENRSAHAGNGHAPSPPSQDTSLPPEERQVQAQPPPPQEHLPSTPGTSPLARATKHEAPDGFTQLEHLLGHCLAAASRVCGHLSGQVRFASEDIRCLGVTLFLESNRKGILPACPPRREPLRE